MEYIYIKLASVIKIKSIICYVTMWILHAFSKPESIYSFSREILHLSHLCQMHQLC